MKLKNSILTNLRMTKHLFKAAPAFCGMNFLNTFFNTITYIILTLWYKALIDEIIYSKEGFAKIGVGFMFYYLITIANFITNSWVKNNFNEKQKVQINEYYKKTIYEKSVEKSVESYQSEQYRNHLHNAVYNDGNYLYTFSEKVFDLLDAIIMFVFFFNIFWHLHPFFILLAFLSAAKNLFCGNKLNRLRYWKYQHNLPFERNTRNIFLLFYSKQYAREFRLYPIGNYFIEKYKSLKQECWKENKKNVYSEALTNTISEIVDLVISLTNIAILAIFLFRGLITVGEFSLVLTNFGNAVGNIQRLLTFLPNIYHDAWYMNDILTVIDGKANTPQNVFGGKKHPRIKMENVSFSYNQNKIALNNINLEIPLDKKIALMGENGAGKSTFIKVLTGLYKPTSGKIKYYYSTNMINCSKLFSLLLQNYQIFALSIAENVIPDGAVNKQKVDNALLFSGLKEKIDTLPDGIDTVLTGEFSESGVSFSGGEKQKLAISRTYAADRPVMILDEPSGNLDPLAENGLIKKINELTNKKAVILITHNPVYAKNVDLILFFHQGCLVEHGTPEELIQKKGYYYRMLVEKLKMGEQIHD